jgi:hypothetical protein
MKNRAEIQRQNNSSLNNVFNNILKNILNNIKMTLDNLTIVGTFFSSVYGELYSTYSPYANYHKYMDCPCAHERR